MDAPRPLTIGIVAGESSGDHLGAELIRALRARVPETRFAGVAGPKMSAAGCETWARAEELAVMGLFEVLHHLPRLWSLRREVRGRLLALRPDVFVGVDAPEFNLNLAPALHAAGVRTVQYVSPQVWAWRQGRVRKIGRAVDLVLCLLPFETAFYARHNVAAVFVGHPLADQIPREVDREAARAALGLEPSATVIALLPGSRVGEVERLGADFLRGAAWLHERRPELKFIAPMATSRAREAFARKQAQVSAATPILLVDGRAQQALAACDAAIVASGTATLETLLSRRPMVVAYRFGALTAFLLRRLRLVKVPYFSQPNLLVGRPLVPELLQEQVSGAALGEALLARLFDREYLREIDEAFRRVHENLRGGAAARAAEAILALLRERGAQGRPA